MAAPTLSTYVNGTVMAPAAVRSDFDALIAWMNGLASTDFDADSIGSRALEVPVSRGYPVNGVRGLVSDYGNQRAPLGYGNPEGIGYTDEKFSHDGAMVKPQEEEDEFNTLCGQTIRTTRTGIIVATATLLVEHERNDLSTWVGPGLGRLSLRIRTRRGERVSTNYSTHVQGFHSTVATSPECDYRQFLQPVTLLTSTDPAVAAGVYDVTVGYLPTDLHADINTVELSDVSIQVRVLGD